MCGIAGVAAADSALLEPIGAMTRALRHRGPDDEGYLVAATRQRRNDRHLVAVLQRRALALERFDRLAVHVDVHVLMYLAALVAHEPLQATVRGLELIEQPADIDRGDLDAVAVVRGPTKRGRDVDGHGHA